MMQLLTKIKNWKDGNFTFPWWGQLGILLGLVFLVSFPLFGSGYPYTHDGELHWARVASYAEELRAGQFPVRWSEQLNYGYGYPIFNFVYPLPYILASGVYLTGIPIEWSLKLVIFLSSVFGALCLYLACKVRKYSNLESFLATFLFLIIPYHLLDIYIRMAYGEILALSFVPVIWLGLGLLENRPFSRFSPLVLLFALSGLILSHNILSMMFLGVFSLYVLVLKRDILKIYSLCVVLALGISCFFWLPSLGEIKYTLAKTYLASKDIHDNFLTLPQLFSQPWTSDSKHTPAFLGWESVLVLFLGVVVFFKTRSKEVLFWLSITFFACWLTLASSKFIWESIPLMAFFQLPWRFLSIIVFTVPIIAVLSLRKIYNSRLRIFLTGIFFLPFFILNIGKVQFLKFENWDNDFFLNYPKSTTWHNEGSPIWTAGEMGEFATSQFFLLGSGEIVSSSKKSLSRELTIQADDPLRLLDNTVFFPGWKAFVDGQEVKIQFQDPNYRGLITFDIPQGEHQVSIVFGRTKIRWLAEGISILSLFLAGGWIWWGRKTK